MRTTLAAVLLTPLLVLAACRGVGYEGESPDKYQPDPAQRVAEAVVWCKRAGYPVVRLEVREGVTRVRCAEMSVVVHEPRVVR